MAATWEEIRQLQADFAQAQLTKNAQKLSERNCIELVLRLIDLKLIDVVHTVDGREYVTRQQMRREIEDELSVHAGRLSLPDLAASLSLDYSIVEIAANELLIDRPKDYNLVLGQLISAQYMDRIAEEVDDDLQTEGFVNLAQLTTKYDLPLEFLRSSFSPRLGSIIHGQVDSFDQNVFYTRAFLSRHRARVTGATRGVTRPTPVASLLQAVGCQPRIFFAVLDELIELKKVAGSLIGGHQETATFVPDVYSRTQDEWVSAFYSQNGYFDYSTMSRLGISDPKSYIQKNYSAETRENALLHLSSLCVGKGFLTSFEGLVEDVVSSRSWFDVATQDVTSVSLNDKDLNKLLLFILKKLKIGEDKVKIYDDTILFCQDFKEKMLEAFTPKITEAVKAKSADNAKIFKKACAAGAKATSPTSNASSTTSASSTMEDDSKDDRRKRAAGGRGSNKSGGGTAREIKTKSAKKKGGGGKRGGGDDDEEDDASSRGGGGRGEVCLELMSAEEMTQFLEDTFEGFPESLATEMAEELERPVNRKYTEEAKTLFNAASGSVADKRKMHQAVGDRVNSLITEIRMYEKAIAIVGKSEPESSDEVVETKSSKSSSKETSLHAQLSRYLLKTLGTEVTNSLFNLAAADILMKVENESSMTYESRLKILTNVANESLKNCLTKVNATLSELSIVEFLTQAENLASELQILVKKVDKKKDKQLLQSHRAALLEKLQGEDDAAILLHLAVSLAFQNSHQAMLHCSGRMIPQLIAFLSPKMDEGLLSLISSFQEKVVKTLGKKLEEEEANQVTNDLAELATKLKEGVITMRKASVSD